MHQQRAEESRLISLFHGIDFLKRNFGIKLLQSSRPLQFPITKKLPLFIGETVLVAKAVLDVGIEEKAAFEN